MRFHLAGAVLLACSGCANFTADATKAQQDLVTAEIDVCIEYDRYRPVINTVEVVGAVVPGLGQADALVESAQPTLEAFCNGNAAVQAAEAQQALDQLKQGVGARAPVATAALPPKPAPVL
jgi:hypothetical protein